MRHYVYHGENLDEEAERFYSFSAPLPRNLELAKSKTSVTITPIGGSDDLESLLTTRIVSYPQKLMRLRYPFWLPLRLFVLRLNSVDSAKK